MLRWPLKPKPVRKKSEANPDAVAVTRVTCPSFVPRHVAEPRLLQARRPAHTLGHLADTRSRSRSPRRARKEEHPWRWGGGRCQLKGSVAGFGRRWGHLASGAVGRERPCSAKRPEAVPTPGPWISGTRGHFGRLNPDLSPPGDTTIGGGVSGVLARQSPPDTG